MQVHISSDAEELSRNVADWILSLIKTTLTSADRFTIALSGGSTPQKLHKILASPEYAENIPWEKLHFFWGDERAVPFEDERNNARMAFDTLLDKVPVEKSQIHIMRTDIGPEESAKEYEQILHQYFDGRPHSFDLVLLGMGDDGHTLSLFPGTEIVHETAALAKAFYLDAQKMYRISLTAPIVNNASQIAFLAAGSSKAHTLKEVLQGDFKPDTYPSQMIKSVHGELHWFIDKAAAADLGEQ